MIASFHTGVCNPRSRVRTRGPLSIGAPRGSTSRKSCFELMTLSEMSFAHTAAERDSPDFETRVSWSLHELNPSSTNCVGNDLATVDAISRSMAVGS